MTQSSSGRRYCCLEVTTSGGKGIAKKRLKGSLLGFLNALLEFGWLALVVPGGLSVSEDFDSSRRILVERFLMRFPKVTA